MSDNKKIEESIDFVASHYQKDAFSPLKGWRRFSLVEARRFAPRHVAAACIASVVLVASASIFYISSQKETQNPPVEQAASSPRQPAEAPQTGKSMRIEFADASLKDVVKQIENTYGVKITNVPQEEMRLTISYEGTASDLITTINDLLGINLELEPEQ